GSSEGTSLASEVLQRFREMHMDHTWSESLHATLQFPHRSLRSSLWLLDSGGLVSEQVPLNPSDYCPYGAAGTAQVRQPVAMPTAAASRALCLQGGVVYANYGRQQDFHWLQSSGVSVGGAVVVIRVGGGVSFAEKVWLAEKSGAGGVLIYPDPADLPQDPRRLGLSSHTAVSEHVHLGSGDPFTPGFPSFNHSLVPPLQSSGLPLIPALPVSAAVAAKLLSQLTGPSCPPLWRPQLPYVRCLVGPDLSSGRRVRMSVTDQLMPVQLNNVFSSLEGRLEPDQYIILGAQRDSLGPGAVKSGVGTAVLLELARTFSAMVKNGFSPRRSLLFVSWDAGDFGNVGATEWLEGYLSMLHLKAVAYFSLDQAVMGQDVLSAHSSPLLVDLLDAAIKQVEHPKHAGQTIYTHAERNEGSWRIRCRSTAAPTPSPPSPVFQPWSSGSARSAPTRLSTPPWTAWTVYRKCWGGVWVRRGGVWGSWWARWCCDWPTTTSLPLRITAYAQAVLQFSAELNKHSAELQSRGLSPRWVFSARGDYSRAAQSLQSAIDRSDLYDPAASRSYNARIMRVEYFFLSQYVSAVDAPFRHVIHGRGEHTLSALSEHLDRLTSDPERFDDQLFRRQLALFTWTLQGAANAMSARLWNVHTTHTHTQ
ncbi:unnamed protein product, partial [Tetraodon nigroviridis]